MRRLFLVMLLLATALASTATPHKSGKDGVWGNLEFRLFGPALGGRITRVAGVAGDPLTYYAAAAQGGVWKSVDGGHDWLPIFDEQPTLSIGSLALAPSDPSTLYVGSGEANIRGNVTIGHGIFVSRDAGQSWQQVWKTKGQIGTLAVHPKDAATAFAAVLGSPFGASAERGVYRTRDAGQTWQRVLFVDERSGAADVAIDRNRPAVVFAGLWQARRTPWNLSTAGPGSGLYRSRDGGDHWERLDATRGLPTGDWGRVGVAVAPSDSQRVYALIEAEQGGLFRSDDGGEKWTRINAHRVLRQRSWYYSTLTIDPHNPDIVWVPQVPLLRSIDGGKTFAQIDGPHHGDHHDLWIDPSDPRRMIDGNDGGIDISLDGGKSWFSPALPLAQLYNIDVDDRVPYHIGGTVQDMGTFSGPSRSRYDDGNLLSSFIYAGGGEAGDFVYDRARIGHIYAGEYSGTISHHIEGSGVYRNISAYPFNGSGHGAIDAHYRFQWTAPIADSPHDPRVLYHGANVLFKSLDQGETWTAISPDLTRNDPSKQQWSGGPITGDNTGVEVYDTIFSIAESPAQKDLIWVGSDDGLIHMSRDAGASWRNVSSKGWPEWATVEAIEPSPVDPGTAYAVIDAHRLDDFRPYVFVTEDFGAHWASLVTGLPADMSTLVLRVDSKDPRLLYLGGDRGLFLSRDRGQHWTPLQLGMPPAAVVDIEARHDDLIVATRGRGVWILDDVSPLRALDDDARSKPLQLLPSKPALRLRKGSRWGDQGRIEDPPVGASISYWLQQAIKDDADGKPKSELRVEIRDQAGALVRTLSSIAKPARWPEDDLDEPEPKPEPDLSASQGLNRVVWDLRYDGARIPDKIKIDAGNPAEGPLALPGTYQLKLILGDRTSTGEITVIADPQAPASATQMAAALAHQLTLRAALERNAAAIDTVRAARQQASELLDRLPKGSTALRNAAQAVVDQADAIEAKLHNPKAEVNYDILSFPGGAQLYSQLSTQYGFANASDLPPPQGQREQWAELSAELERMLAEVEAFKRNQIAVLERAVHEADLPRLILPQH